MTDDLVAWLTAQVNADEAAALLCSPWPWRLNAEHDTVLADDDIEVAEIFALSNNQLRNTAAHIALHDPARVLREIEFKRAVLKAHRPQLLYNQVVLDHDGTQRLRTLVICRTCEPPQEITRDTYPCATLRHMAAVYADRPGYDESWKP